MNLSQIHHIAIIVSDYEASKDFYVNKLGFQIVRENYRPERNDWKLDLKVNETTELEIFGVKNPPARVTRPEAAGLRHLAFFTDNIEETVAELKEKGIVTEPIRVDEFSGKSLLFSQIPTNCPSSFMNREIATAENKGWKLYGIIRARRPASQLPG